MQETDFVNMELNEVVIKKSVLSFRNEAISPAIQADALHPIVSSIKLFKLKYYPSRHSKAHTGHCSLSGAIATIWRLLSCTEAGLRSIACPWGRRQKVSHTPIFADHSRWDLLWKGIIQTNFRNAPRRFSYIPLWPAHYYSIRRFGRWGQRCTGYR